MKTGQEYKQGLVIQHSPEGSAFQEVISATIDENGIFEAKLPGGIKKIDVSTTIKAGEPVEVTALPEAGADYEDLVYSYNNSLYVCKETSEDVYVWVEQVDKDSQLGLPLVYENLPEASAEYAGKFAKVGDDYYLCDEFGAIYRWFAMDRRPDE